MATNFTWERGPFENCWQCGENTLGILSAGGDGLTMRCTKCRYSHTEVLPKLDKKVFYLDQNVFSILFKVASGGKLPVGHEDFSKELYHRLKELVLLQQIVLPHSNIHRDETIVFHSAEKLREAYESIGGDISFINFYDVEASQIYECCLSYIEKREPKHNFEVDEVLEDERNHWLADLHIGVKSDFYGKFADDIRRSRERTHAEMQKLFEQWAQEKPRFDAVLDRELKSFGTSRRQNLFRAVKRMMDAAQAGDPMEIAAAVHEPILSEFEMLKELFGKTGVPETQLGPAVNEFWLWEGNHHLPHLRLTAYLFAAFARRAASGQKKITRGLMNDVTAIATYAPYVDAMFLDRECAELLREERLRNDLNYKAKIFSFSNGEEFLRYLDEIKTKIPAEVREYATRIYGL